MSLHVASGAAAGAALGSHRRAVLAGAALHALGDTLPHRDIASRRFELRSGILLLAVLAVRCGPLSPAVIGAVASSVPDAEHVVRLPRPRGRKLFPSHRWRGWHRTGGVSAGAQLVAAGVLFGLVASGPRVR